MRARKAGDVFHSFDLVEDQVKEPPDYCNLVLLIISFVFVFVAFSTAQGYTTSLHPESGSVILGILYVVFAVSNLFAPLLVDIFGDYTKVGMAIAGATYLPFILCLGLPQEQVYTDILLCAGAVLVGVGASVLWAAHGKLLLLSSTGLKISQFSTIFWALFQWNVVIGFGLAELLKLSKLEMVYRFIIFGWICAIGLILLLFLRNKHDDEEDALVLDFGADDSFVPVLSEFEEEFPLTPGGEFDGDASLSGRMMRLRRDRIRCCCCFCSRRRCQKVRENWEGNSQKLVKQLLSATRVLCDLRCILLYPFFIVAGFSYSFFFGNLVARFGTGWLPFVFVDWGLSQIFLSILQFGRIFDDFSGSISVCLAVLFTLLLVGAAFALDTLHVMNIKIDWPVVAMDFVVSTFAGLADCAWSSVNYSLVARYFSSSKAAGYAAYKFINAIGIAVQLLLQDSMNFRLMLFLIFGFTLLGSVLFGVLDLCVDPVDKKKSKPRNLNLLDWLQERFLRLCCRRRSVRGRSFSMPTPTPLPDPGPDDDSQSINVGTYAEVSNWISGEGASLDSSSSSDGMFVSPASPVLDEESISALIQSTGRLEL